MRPALASSAPSAGRARADADEAPLPPIGVGITVNGARSQQAGREIFDLSSVGEQDLLGTLEVFEAERSSTLRSKNALFDPSTARRSLRK